MENILLLTTELIKLCLPIFIGYICVKTGYIRKDSADSLAGLIARVLLPVMLFCALVNPDLPRETIWDTRYMLLTGFAWVAVCFFIGLAIARLLKLNRSQAPVFMILTGMYNVTYMGTPLCKAIYGEQVGGMGVAIVSLAGHISMWVLGVILISVFYGNKKGFDIKKALSPVSIALMLAIALKLLGITLPQVVFEPLNHIGDITPYLAMMFIGMMMARADFKGVLRQKSIPVFLFVKLLGLPLLLGLIMNTAGRLYLDDTYRGLLLIEFSTSAMISLTAYFKEEGMDADFAAKLVFMSIVLNILTLPTVMFLNSLY